MKILINRKVENICNIENVTGWKHIIEDINNRVVLFIDTNIKKLYGLPVIDGLVFEVEAKDEYKNLSYYSKFIDDMGKNKMDTHTVVVSVGGGSVSNLAGFIAGTYKRGVEFVSFPTTLLAMTDACISYKQALNTGYGKNQIGCYKVPSNIYIYYDFLKTLDIRFIWDGYAEIIKHAVCENFTLSNDDMFSNVMKTIQAKIEHVRNDPWEKHPIIMYGHQYGHALEYVSKGGYYHGEAVNVGMIGASHVGHVLGIHDDILIKRHRQYSDTFNLPKMFSCGDTFNLNEMFEFMYNDKSVKNDQIHFSFGENMVDDTIKVETDTLCYGLNKTCIDRMIFPNKYEMHKVAYGTFNVNVNDVYNAIKCGYRTIDCAHFYENEIMIGNDIKRCIDEGVCTREDLFIIGKLWNDQHDDVKAACQTSIDALQVEYLDMYLVHWPVVYKDGERFDADVVEVFAEMKKLEGTLCKNVGVSNFKIEHLEKIKHMKPALNQIELHPYFQQKELRDYCDKNMISVMAYSPMSKDALTDEYICAIANERECNPSVMVMSWILNTGAALAVKSVTHMSENLDSNFILSEREIDSIKDKNIRIIQER
jgi:alcohol dehydrogenase (NADP+)